MLLACNAKPASSQGWRGDNRHTIRTALHRCIIEWPIVAFEDGIPLVNWIFHMMGSCGERLRIADPPPISRIAHFGRALEKVKGGSVILVWVHVWVGMRARDAGWPMPDAMSKTHDNQSQRCERKSPVTPAAHDGGRHVSAEDRWQHHSEPRRRGPMVSGRCEPRRGIIVESSSLSGA